MVCLPNVQHPMVCKCQIYVNLYADILFLGKFKAWPSRDMDTGSVSLIVLMIEHPDCSASVFANPIKRCVGEAHICKRAITGSIHIKSITTSTIYNFKPYPCNLP